MSDSKKISPSTSGLSHAGRPAPTHLASSAAADEALRRLVTSHREKKRLPPSRRRSPPLRASITRVQNRVGRAIEKTGAARWFPRVLGAVACLGLLTAAGFLLIPKSTRLHGVAGNVRFDDTPLGDCVLEFQSKGPTGSGKPFRTVIHPSNDGTFRRDPAAGLPSGTYAVVVKPRRPGGADAKRLRPQSIPAAYTQLASTPLHVEINGGATALELVVRR